MAKKSKDIQKIFRILSEGQTKTERKNAKEFFKKVFGKRAGELKR